MSNKTLNDLISSESTWSDQHRCVVCNGRVKPGFLNLWSLRLTIIFIFFLVVYHMPEI